MPGAEQERGQVRRPDAADPHHRHVDQRLALRTSTTTQAAADDEAGGEQPERPRRAPAPRRRLADREQDAPRCRSLISTAASQLTPAGDAHRRLRDEPPGAERRRRRSRRAASRRASASSGARRSGRRRRCRCRRRCRGSRTGGRCSRPPSRAGTRRGRCRTRAGRCRRRRPGSRARRSGAASVCESAASSVPPREHDERPDEHVLLAVHVAEPAEDRRADRGGEQIAGEEPGDAGLASCAGCAGSSAGRARPPSSAPRTRARPADSTVNVTRGCTDLTVSSATTEPYPRRFGLARAWDRRPMTTENPPAEPAPPPDEGTPPPPAVVPSRTRRPTRAHRRSPHGCPSPPPRGCPSATRAGRASARGCLHRCEPLVATAAVAPRSVPRTTGRSGKPAPALRRTRRHGRGRSVSLQCMADRSQAAA